MQQHAGIRFLEPYMVVLKHAAACRGTKNFALFIVIDNCLSAPSAPSALFAWETFCLTHIPPVLYYLSCHERVNSTINYTTDDPDGESDQFGSTAWCMLSLVCEFRFPLMPRYPHVQVEACRSMPQHAAAQDFFPRDCTCLTAGILKVGM
jgi:hypothetical protein